MVRTNQGGSVLSFVIVGVILVGLILGGAFFVRQRITQPTMPSQPDPVVVQPEKTQQESSPKQEEITEQTATKEESSDSGSLSDDSTTTPGSTVKLPQTGPVETISVLVALTSLSIAGVSYVRSRRMYLPL